MALPIGNVRFMAESGTHVPQSNTITVDDFFERFAGVAYLTCHFWIDLKDTSASLYKMFERSDAITISDCLVEIMFARSSNKSLVENRSATEFWNLIQSWGLSHRRCMDPVDYVYGVLGILQIKMPRMTDPDQVWKRFLSELDNYMEMEKMKEGIHHSGKRLIFKICDDAYKVDLQKVKDMTFVYKGLLTHTWLKT